MTGGIGIIDGKKRNFILVFSGTEFKTRKEASKEAKRKDDSQSLKGISRVFFVRLKVSCADEKRIVEKPEKRYVLTSSNEIWNYPQITVGGVLVEAEKFDPYLRGEANFYEVPPFKKKT